MYYRCSRQAGGTYFFTVNLQDRFTEQINLLSLTLSQVKKSHPFRMDVIVILPDHMHTIWTLRPNDNDYATRRD